ncbi:MAG: hypothetical protein IPL90_17860 [Holophagales bacterium]|nr:hypothetical protein [Holophagales bacterium]
MSRSALTSASFSASFSGRRDRLGVLVVLDGRHEAREERVERRGEEEDDRDEPRKVDEEVLGAAARHGADDDGLDDDPAEEDRDRGDEERLGHREPGEPRAEREEAGEDGALRGEPHGDARDADVLGREELAELPLLPLQERLPPDGGEALERLRER